MGRTASFLLFIILLSGCSSRPRITVGSKNFTEQVLLGEILAQHIERSLGVEVERKLNLGGTLLAHQALKGGAIDLYPEYTGTALTAILQQAVAGDPKAVLSRVRDGYKPLGLTWLPPLGFDNTFAMVVRAGTNVSTISDAARRPAPWRLGVGYEFVQRPDGLEGLVKTYGLKVADQPSTMDLGLLYTALRGGQIEMAAASATDGLLASKDFVVLADDRHYFPPYECAVVVRDQSLEKFPGLQKTLEELSSSIPPEVMRRMNAAVDTDHRAVADVAREFLNGRGQ